MRRPSSGASADDLRKRRARQVDLRDEAAGMRVRHSIAVRTRIATRDEDDDRRRWPGRKVLGHLEAIGVRQLDVQQDDTRAKLLDLVEGFGAIGCFPDHVKPVRLQELASSGPKVAMIVDDQHGRSHRPMVF